MSIVVPVLVISPRPVSPVVPVVGPVDVISVVVSIPSWSYAVPLVSDSILLVPTEWVGSEQYVVPTSWSYCTYRMLVHNMFAAMDGMDLLPSSSFRWSSYDLMRFEWFGTFDALIIPVRQS